MPNFPVFSFFCLQQLAMEILMRKDILGRKPVKAYGGNGRSAIYEYGDGTGFMRNSGSFTWRNKNPGAINSGKFAQKHGSIGNNGRFAVFPDYKTGRDTTYKLLQIPKYNTVTLGQVFYIYAPPSDGNDTEAYIRHVVAFTGLGRDQSMADLTERERWSIVDAIIEKEVYKAGDKVPLAKLKKKYKWRMPKDESARENHKAREGNIYSWDNPPEDGHPSEAPGCRCWAEAYEYPCEKVA
jgi:hypothetical protein